MFKQKIIVYVDGGSRGNPGPSAIGVVLDDGLKKREYSEFLGKATNNEAEYKAVILALKKVKQIYGGKKAKESEIKIRTDSELIARQLNGKYKIENENLAKLFIEVWNLKTNFGKVEFKEIPREQNKEADKLVNQELDKQEMKLF